MMLRYDVFRINIQRCIEKAWLWIAWHLPGKLVYTASIRLMAHATTGEYGNTIPDELNVMEAFKRWDQPL